MQENIDELYESFKKNPLINPRTGYKIKENGPTQTKLKKEFEKFIKDKNELKKNTVKKQSSIYEVISRYIEEEKEKLKTSIPNNNVRLINVKLLSDQDDPLSEGIERAYQITPKDEFTPSMAELNRFVLAEFKKKENSPIKDMMIIYEKKRLIAQKCISDNRNKITDLQYNKIYNSIIDIVVDIYTKLLKIWRDNAIRAHNIYKELLQIDEKDKKNKSLSTIKKEKNLDEDLCIICLDDIRSTVYKPCFHRVCCNNCAEMLWHRDQTCPWCREPCNEP